MVFVSQYPLIWCASPLQISVDASPRQVRWNALASRPPGLLTPGTAGRSTPIPQLRRRDAAAQCKLTEGELQIEEEQMQIIQERAAKTQSSIGLDSQGTGNS